MFKHKVNAFFFCLLALTFSLQDAKAVSSTFEDELNYYIECGIHSRNFFSNILEGRDEKTQEVLLDLQQQSEERGWRLPEKETIKAAQKWVSLTEQDEGDTPSHILYLSKSLELRWNAEVALTLADKCHQLVQKQTDPQLQIKLAYRGFATLGVKLKEPDYDLHKKLRAVPQVINLLEDLKASTVAIPSVADLPLPLYNEIFHENCIPQAEICALLTVAYGGEILLSKSDLRSSKLNILNNGKEAIALYQKGLKGKTTPGQREYYHSQIVNLVHGFSRTSDLATLADEQYHKLKKKSALEIARIYKDRREECESTSIRTALAYHTALAYMYADKKDKALKYIGIVSDVRQEECEKGLSLNRIKTRAEHLRLQIEDPSRVFAYEYQNASILLR